MIGGIDPGKTGAVAIQWDDGRINVIPFDDFPDEKYGNMHGFILIERGHAMPKQGATSGFKFGVSCGRAQGWCEAMDVSWDFVSAVDWQRVMLRGEPRKTRKDRKAASIRVAQRLFPNVDLTLGVGKAPKDGASDALLIAEYARRAYPAP